VDRRNALFRAEDDMHKVEAQRLWHRTDYMSGLQPFPDLANAYLGLRPRLICRRTFGPQCHTSPRRHSFQSRLCFGSEGPPHNRLGRSPRNHPPKHQRAESPTHRLNHGTSTKIRLLRNHVASVLLKSTALAMPRRQPQEWALAQRYK
jgi:hypothetical protein